VTSDDQVQNYNFPIEHSSHQLARAVIQVPVYGAPSFISASPWTATQLGLLTDGVNEILVKIIMAAIRNFCQVHTCSVASMSNWLRQWEGGNVLTRAPVCMVPRAAVCVVLLQPGAASVGEAGISC
jgi:hypothetical protein